MFSARLRLIGITINHLDCAGHAEVEAKRPWRRDLIARIYSMTKPVTAVALLMLYEEARVHLDDPSKHICRNSKIANF